MQKGSAQLVVTLLSFAAAAAAVVVVVGRLLLIFLQCANVQHHNEKTGSAHQKKPFSRSVRTKREGGKNCINSLLLHTSTVCVCVASAASS